MAQARGHVADRARWASHAMDRLHADRHRETDPAQQAEGDALRARLSVTGYTYRARDAAVPPGVASAPVFRRMIDGALSPLDPMWEAITAAEQRPGSKCCAKSAPSTGCASYIPG